MTVNDGVSPSPKGGGAEPAPPSKSATENEQQNRNTKEPRNQERGNVIGR